MRLAGPTTKEMPRTMATVTRAVTFSVAKVHDGGTWKEFMQTMHECWRIVTAASNGCMRHYVQTDQAGPTVGQIPACPKLYCYPLVTRFYPELHTSVAASVARSTEREYRRNRIQFWRGNMAVPLYRYPAPYPIPKQKWSPCLVDGQRPGVCFATGSRKGDGINRWTLTLSGGPGFARQLKQFRQILAGEADRCDLTIYRQRCGGTGHNQTSEKSAGGASRVSYRVMVKIVAKFQVADRPAPTGALVLKTDPEALWVACHDGRCVQPWVLNADDARKWLAWMKQSHLDHAARRQRLAEDSKLERRTHVGHRGQLQGAMDTMCEKHRRRLKTFCAQAAASVVGYCRRQGLATLIYDDTERGWMPSFPWSKLKTELRNRCEAAGIEPGGSLLLGDGGEEVEVSADAD